MHLLFGKVRKCFTSAARKGENRQLLDIGSPYSSVKDTMLLHVPIPFVVRHSLYVPPCQKIIFSFEKRRKEMEKKAKKEEKKKRKAEAGAAPAEETQEQLAAETTAQP